MPGERGGGGCSQLIGANFSTKFKLVLEASVTPTRGGDGGGAGGRGRHEFLCWCTVRSTAHLGDKVRAR